MVAEVYHPVRGGECIQRAFRATTTNLVALAGAVVKSKALYYHITNGHERYFP